jgi:hypothetical protein
MIDGLLLLIVFLAGATCAYVLRYVVTVWRETR